MLNSILKVNFVSIFYDAIVQEADLIVQVEIRFVDQFHRLFVSCFSIEFGLVSSAKDIENEKQYGAQFSSFPSSRTSVAVSVRICQKIRQEKTMQYRLRMKLFYQKKKRSYASIMILSLLSFIQSPQKNPPPQQRS
jgi:hypothetical protein